MASKIQLKRGNNASLAALTLDAGEPAFVLDTGKLYVGNGTQKILINPDQSATATQADKLTTARSIALTGGVAGSANFDGSQNISISTVVADDSHNHIVGNVDGLQAALDAKALATNVYTKSDIDTKLTAVYKYKGTVANFAALPSTAQVAGDVYNLTDTGENFAWDGATWDDIGGTVPAASGTTAGLMSSADFTKLGTVTASATPTNAANVGLAISGTTAKATPVDADTFAANDSAASNALTKVTWANIKAVLKTYFDTLYNKYIHPNHTGDVTSVADGAQTIAAAAVTNAKMANMIQATIKGRATASTGSPEDLTATQVRTILNVADGANAYAHPLGDGNLHVPATSTTSSGKVLTAGATAGSLSWMAPATDLTVDCGTF